MPVFIRTRQATQFQPKYDSHVIQADFGHQPLKPGTVIGCPAAKALVLVDDDDSLRCPTYSPLRGD